jgi:hypothetical protein
MMSSAANAPTAARADEITLPLPRLPFQVIAGRLRQGKITKRGRKRLRTLAIRAVSALSQGPATPLAEFYALKK